MEYEEQWRQGARRALSGSKFESLIYHCADVQLGIVKIALNLRSRQTKLARVLALYRRNHLQRIAYGRIFWVGYLVEVAEGGCRLALLPNLRRPVPWRVG